MEAGQFAEGVFLGYPLSFTRELKIFLGFLEHVLGFIQLAEGLRRIGDDTCYLTKAEKRTFLGDIYDSAT